MGVSPSDLDFVGGGGAAGRGQWVGDWGPCLMGGGLGEVEFYWSGFFRAFKISRGMRPF